MSRSIYCGTESVLPVLEKSELVSEQDEIKIYSFESSEWVYYETSSLYLDDAFPILHINPKPKVQELVKLVISSEFNDEAYGACFVLRDSELIEHQEFREELIKELASINFKKQGIEEKTRIQNIILFSELENPENRRSIVGKNSEEIEQDSEYYVNLASEAHDLIRKTKPSLLERIRLKLKKE